MRSHAHARRWYPEGYARKNKSGRALQGDRITEKYTKNTLLRVFFFEFPVAPRIGFEPMTYRLTAGCSTAELSGSGRNGSIL